jgi:hypothetical protein
VVDLLQELGATVHLANPQGGPAVFEHRQTTGFEPQVSTPDSAHTATRRAGETPLATPLPPAFYEVQP